MWQQHLLHWLNSPLPGPVEVWTFLVEVAVVLAALGYLVYVIIRYVILGR